MYSSASFTVSNSFAFSSGMLMPSFVGVEAVGPEILPERRIEGDLGLVDLEPVGDELLHLLEQVVHVVSSWWIAAPFKPFPRV
jgi:hypothetical protein